MSMHRRSGFPSRLAARGGLMLFLGLLATIIAACGPGTGRTGY